MNPLFKRATKALRATIRAEFRASRLGQIFAKAERELLKRGRARSYMKRTAAKIRSLLTPDEINRVAELGGAQPSRYAKKQSDRKIMDTVYRALGPLGEILSAFMRPMGRAIAGSLERELEGAARFLQAFGWGVVKPPSARAGKADEIRAVAEMAEKLGFKLEPLNKSPGVVQSGPFAVAPPGSDAPGPAAPTPGPKYRPLPGWAEHIRARQAAANASRSTPPRERTTIDVDFGTGITKRVKLDDPVLTGEMIPVVSSNVHSIGFDVNTHHPAMGTLKVRFLQHNGRGNSKVAGPLYFYYNVQTEIFRRFQKAASKGKFVWDNLRIRGTVSGHRFDYSLMGISRGYVPRKATYTPGGEYFQKRTFLGEHYKTGEKRLFQSAESALVRPGSGRPDNGRPNNGRPRGPNRGR